MSDIDYKELWKATVLDVASAGKEIDRLRAANARLQAWHDAVMGQEVVGTYYAEVTGVPALSARPVD